MPTSAVEGFIQKATEGLVGGAARVALFMAIRNLPYATDGAHDAVDLVRLERGDCLAKSDLLASGLKRLGHPTRRVRSLYFLPDKPAEVFLLPSREDIHTAIEVQLGENWLLVDATHDPPLARGGLTVADWDGQTPTPLAYETRGLVWRAGEDERIIQREVERITRLHSSVTTAQVAMYRVAFNAWLHAMQQAHQTIEEKQP